MKFLLSLLFILVSFSTASSAFADSAKRACLKDARGVFKESVNEAKDDLRLAEGTCKFGPVVAACKSSCFQNFKACLKPVSDSLLACRQSCMTDFIAARDAARTTLGCGTNCGTNTEYQKDMIHAQLGYYSCRIACRGTPDSVNARAVCRTTFSSCSKACNTTSN